MQSVPTEQSQEGAAVSSEQPQNLNYFFPPEQSNPFELDDGDDYVDDEVLDVHNRSTQQHNDSSQLPARVIDNGMANQFRVESIQNKQLQQVKEQQQAGKPSKQEMSRTQPMPGHVLQGAKKAAAKQKLLEQQQPL